MSTVKLSLMADEPAYTPYSAEERNTQQGDENDRSANAHPIEQQLGMEYQDYT
jgi:hypothetical protein